MNNHHSKYDLITILGPTASGKTTLAAALAYDLNLEIISADSRQVYRKMDIGTGKDLADYKLNNKQIPYHLIDICDAGEKYNVYEFQHDFHEAYQSALKTGNTPILCGGSGMYIEAVLKGFKLLSVPENTELRAVLQSKSKNELKTILAKLNSNHQQTDFDSAKRIIRAIEIAKYSQDNELKYNEFKPINSLIIGVDLDREMRRQKITSRLKQRLADGMIEEVKALLGDDVSPNDLIYYGLEYKFVTMYLIGKLNYNDMFNQLEIAIHQFAKRQMTWFRGMEKRGFKINWIDASLDTSDKVDILKSLIH